MALCPGCCCPAPAATGKRPRIWCSEKCRKWYQSHPGTFRRVGRSCRVCGVDISDKVQDAIYCSKRCGEVALGRRLSEPIPPRPCVMCGVLYAPCNSQARYCSKRCQRKFHKPKGPQPYGPAERARDQRRRARVKQAKVGEFFRIEQIAERDGWRCGICQRSVDAALTWPHPRSRSLDHIIPLSLGGEHSAANARLAHLHCNVLRGNHMGAEQLALIG